ncbi:MAG: GNAT family N-acetyltransferase [Gammaproteobacteria bacterium]
MFSLQVLHNREQFERLAPEWRELLKSSASDGLFLTWEWLFTWWQHLAGNRRLWLVVLREGRDLAAVAPLTLRLRQPRRLLPFRVLEFLGGGNVGSDYLDLIAARGTEQAVIAKLGDYLADQKLVLELSRIRPQAIGMGLLAALRSREYKISERGHSEVCPYINLESLTWESYLANLGAAHRYNVRRRLRNLARSFKLQFDQARSQAECDAWLPLLIALHRKRWDGRRQTSTAFCQPELGAFHREFTALALQRGWLRLQLLRLNDAPAAALYGLNYAGVFYFYQSGFDPTFSRHSIGLATMALTIRSAIAEGAREFDMLHGEEEYKFLWTRQVRQMSHCIVFPPGMRGVLCRRIVRLRERLKHLVRRQPRPVFAGSGMAQLARPLAHPPRAE